MTVIIKLQVAVCVPSEVHGFIKELDTIPVLQLREELSYSMEIIYRHKICVQRK
jgi:hypothetical protein